MKSRVLVACLGLLLAGAHTASADAVFVPALDAGQYDDGGNHNPIGMGHTTGEYPPYYELRSFVAFDLSRVSGTVTGAKLHIKFGGYSGDATETVALHEVTTPVPQLVAGGTGLVAIFDDLADGVLLGSQEVALSQVGFVTFQIPLTAAAIPLLQAAIGGDVAIGLSLSSLSGLSREQLNGFGLILVRMLELEGDLQVDPFEPPGYFAPGFQVIDFEFGITTLPADLPGVSFVSSSPIGPDPWFAGIAEGSGRIFGAQHFGNLYNGDYSDLGIEFDPPVEAVGGWIRNVPDYPNEAQSVELLRISAYAPSGALLEERVVDLPAADAAPTFQGFSNPGGIARIEWSSDDVGFFGVDDITYGDLSPAPVPSLSPIGSGALLLALAGIGCFLARERPDLS